MSTEAVKWAMDDAPMLRTSTGKPDTTSRHVLQALAEHAHKDGSSAHPSVLRLQYRTGFDRRTVQRALRRLEDGKLIQSDGSVHGCTRWRLSLEVRRPASDWEELEAEEEGLRRATAERVRRHRAKRVTQSDDVTVTHSDDVTEPDVTHSDDVRNASEQRYVTHSDDVRNALSAARTTNEPPVEPPATEALWLEPSPTDPDEPTQPPENDTPVTAQTIVAEWLERVDKRPPGSVIGQMAKQIRVLLEDDGIDPDDIRRGIARWMAKGLHPSTLPSVVNEVMNSGASRAQPGTVLALVGQPDPYAVPVPSTRPSGAAEHNVDVIRRARLRRQAREQEQA